MIFNFIVRIKAFSTQNGFLFLGTFYFFRKNKQNYTREGTLNFLILSTAALEQ
jgi:hypothetical protein